MKFFVDTADLNEIKDLNDLGILDGVTTNPSLMKKVGVKGRENVLQHYKSICEMVDGDISAEVSSTDYDGMMREADELASLHENIVIKVPMIREGIKAIKSLSGQGVKTNCTLIFSVGQAILAAKAGATYISPFLGRLDDISTDGLNLIGDLVDVFGNYHWETEILAASIRHPMHIIDCAKLGADVVTCPASSLDKLFNHPLTDSGLAKFLEDYKNVES